MVPKASAAIDRTKYLDQDEVRQLITTAEIWALKDLRAGRRQGIVTWLVVDLALSTGLRVGELARLKVGDFNPRRKALSVTRSKKRSSRSKPETLAISDELAVHLVEYLAWKKLVGEGVGKSDPLMVGKRGPLGRPALQVIWHVVREKAGLPAELSIHSARHTMAVHLLRKTKNLRQVQKQLGHSSPVTTASMYADVSFDDMRAGVNGLFQ